MITNDTAIKTVPHEVHRISVPVPGSFDTFRQAYEEAVPVYDADAGSRSSSNRNADWATDPKGDGG